MHQAWTRRDFYTRRPYQEFRVPGQSSTPPTSAPLSTFVRRLEHIQHTTHTHRQRAFVRRRSTAWSVPVLQQHQLTFLDAQGHLPESVGCALLCVVIGRCVRQKATPAMYFYRWPRSSGYPRQVHKQSHVVSAQKSAYSVAELRTCGEDGTDAISPGTNMPPYKYFIPRLRFRERWYRSIISSTGQI